MVVADDIKEKMIESRELIKRIDTGRGMLTDLMVSKQILENQIMIMLMIGEWHDHSYRGGTK